MRSLLRQEECQLARFKVFFKTLKDLRWQVFGYGVGLALMAALVVAIYPSYKDQFANFEVPEALEGLTGDIDYTSPEGFLSAEFVSWVPIVMLIFAIMAGTSALAGEEANGTLDLLLSQPISRRRLALEKMAGILVATLLITVIACLGWAVSVPFVDIEIALPDLFVATLHLVPITLTFAFLAMFLGAVMADRRAANAAVTALSVASYFLNYLAQIVDALRPLAWASPFKYYDVEALAEGVDWWRTAVLLVVSATFAVATLAFFEKRDIGVSSAVDWRRWLTGVMTRKAQAG
jgi:ABC-2 type transport system permease protein